MRCWQRSFQLCILIPSIFFTNVIARPSEGVDTKSNSIYDPLIDTDRHTRLSSSPLNPISTYPPSLTTRDDGYQAFLHLGDGWNLYYSSWSSTGLPIAPAAWALAQLYSNMAQNAGSIWRLSPPLHSIPLRMGNVYLVMECPEEGIPWDLVQLFGEKLLDMTEKGWLGLYSLRLSNAAKEMTISIILRTVSGKILKSD